jgi:starch-binding outer membrane protein, SusD/RagB family
MNALSLRSKGLSALLSATLVLSACQGLDIPDLNNAGLRELEENPTPSLVASTSTGLLVGSRRDMGVNSSYVLLLGILGREAYSLDPADPRTIVEMLAAPNLDPGTSNFGGNYWVNPYGTIRTAHILLRSLDKVQGLSEAQKESVRGFAKTMLAYNFLLIINTRDTEGAPIDVDRSLEAGPAPIATKEEVFAHIARLLDEAVVHLEAGGTRFPFPLSSGFVGFDTPATFLQVNRALAARVAVYRGNYTQALTALQRSFLNADASLDLGVYHVFGATTGDQPNLLNNANIYAHPKLTTEAERKPNGDVDDRVARKLRNVASRTSQGLTSDKAFTLYTRLDSPVALIRNEELLLLRAEAYVGLGDIVAAAQDLNLIRQRSGGLAPRADLSADNALDELLRQKRYSLLFEGGHRWIDLRRYNRLGDPGLIDVQGHRVHTYFPIPQPEQDARR